MAEVNSMVRIGIVSSVDSGQKTARVFFPDMDNMVSDWIHVLQHPGTTKSSMPKVNDSVLVLYGYGIDTDGFILGVIE